MIPPAQQLASTGSLPEAMGGQIGTADSAARYLLRELPTFTSDDAQAPVLGVIGEVLDAERGQRQIVGQAAIQLSF